MKILARDLRPELALQHLVPVMADRLALDVFADPYSQRVNGLMRYHARRRVGAGVVRAGAFRKLAMVA